MIPDDISMSLDKPAAANIPAELRVLTIEEVAVILGRSAKSVRVDISRNPRSLPPVFRVPGSRKIKFRYVDVVKWMDEVSRLSQQHKEAVLERSAALGIDFDRIGRRRRSTK
jgi:hypothetical protein